MNNMAKIKEEIELKIAELQMDYYMTDNNFANVNDYVKAELEKGVELPSGAVITTDSSGNLSYDGMQIGTLNPDGSVSIDGEFNGSQIVTKYTVSYDANGGTGVPATKKYAAGESVSIDFTTKPTKKGANFLGWATSSTATTPEYTSSGSFTMGSQSVTLYAVWENLAVATISVTNYGDVVNYSANGVNDWQIFLNDGENVYIISSDYVPISGMTTISGISTNEIYKVQGDSQNTLVNWLRNTSNWSKYAEGFSEATAIGGPTLQQFVESYNSKYGTLHSADLSSESYFVNNTEMPYIITNTTNAGAYWLSSEYTVNSNAVRAINFAGCVGYAGANQVFNGIRPLVCLPANAKMNWNGTAWELSN